MGPDRYVLGLSLSLIAATSIKQWTNNNPKTQTPKSQTPKTQTPKSQTPKTQTPKTQTLEI